MIELLKKTLLTGVGLTLMTKDKVEELAREIAKTAQMSKDKGDEFVKEAVARAEKGRTDLEATVQRLVDDAVRKAHLPTRDEFAALEARVAQLEQNAAGRPG